MIQEVSRATLAQRYGFSWEEIEGYMASQHCVIAMSDLSVLVIEGCRDSTDQWVISCPLPKLARIYGVGIVSLHRKMRRGMLLAYCEEGIWHALVRVLPQHSLRVDVTISRNDHVGGVVAEHSLGVPSTISPAIPALLPS